MNAVAIRFVIVRLTADVSHRIFSQVGTTSVASRSQSSREGRMAGSLG